MPTKKPKALKKTSTKKIVAKKKATTKKLKHTVRKKTTVQKPKIVPPVPTDEIEKIAPTTSAIPVAPTPTIAIQPPNKSMLWLAVVGVTLIIGILWLYSLQFTLPKISNSGPTFNEANPQVDEFVDTVENDWSDFQDNVGEFENLIDDELDNKNTSTTPPTDEQLENLFSDIN